MIKKNQILNALRRDLRYAEILRKEWTEKIRYWKAETHGEPYGNEQKGKSRIVSKDIKKQMEWMLPSLADPFLSTPDVIKCNPVTYEDATAARQNELLLNTQFCRKFARYNFIMKALRVLASEGTLVVQTGWDYEDEEVESYVETVMVDAMGQEYIGMQKEMVTKVIRNQPTAVVCRNEDIYIDPTCMDDIDKCQFVIHRYETDLSSLRSDGRYKNLNQVAAKDAESTTRASNDFYPEDHTYFDFGDKPRKKLLVYEYWGNYDVNEDGIAEPIVCAWIGDTIIRLETNPYPDQKPPFVIVPFNAVPFQMHGEPLAEAIGDNQKVKTAITRGIIDNMAQSNNGVVGIRHGALDMNNRKKFLAGKNFEFNGTPGDFWQGGYNQIPSSAFDMLGLMNNEIESQTGVKSFSGGISGSSLGATATGVRGALDATATRRMSLVRNIAENLIKPLMRKWMSYNAEFLEEEEIIRITNDEYVPVRRDDLEGRVDIDISISTAEDNAARANELSFMLQTTAQSMDPDMQFDLMASWARLTRLPEEAKRLEEKAAAVRQQMSQPNPMQEEELRRVRLENDLLQAQIEAAKASTQEDMADRLEKVAMAQLKQAQTRKLNSEADMLDLKYLKDDNEYDRLVDNEKAQRDHSFQRDLAMLQVNAGDKQVGFPR